MALFEKMRNTGGLKVLKEKIVFISWYVDSETFQQAGECGTLK